MQMPSFSKWFKRARRREGWTAISHHSRGLHLCEISYLGGRPVVGQCLFRNESEVTSGALERLRKELGLDDGLFTTLLSPGEYQMLLVDAPNVPVDELRTAIRWKVKDSLAYHIDDATIDVLQIPNAKFAGDRPQTLYAIAASNETVKRHITLFTKARIPLSVIDIPETAQRNVAALYEQEGRGMVLLAFNDDGGLLTFTSDGELYLARRIEISLGQLRDADDSLRQQYLDRVELEVQRSLDYFDRQFHYIPPTRLLISAPAELGLVALLSANLGIPVEQLDLSQVMDISAAPELADSEFLSYALHTVGAALRQEKKAL